MRDLPSSMLSITYSLLQVEQLKQERMLLDRLDDPGIVGFYFSFQDLTSIYFGLELCPNGTT